MAQRIFHRGLAVVGLVTSLAMSLPAMAWELAGVKTIKLHGRDGVVVPIGTVNFQSQGEKTAFTVQMDHARLKDYFLSMREFKCVDAGVEVQCHTPYPYANPRTVLATGADWVWLEHSLLFLYKLPKDFGAKWWNGLYYKLKLTDQGLVGTPEAIDLNLISAPSAKFTEAPYGPAQRSEIAPDARWFSKLTIE